MGKVDFKKFFEQLKENVDEQKFKWIKELYNEVESLEKFKVVWGRGERWFTMRFFVKAWYVEPLDVQGDIKVWINYTGNPAINPWQLSQKTQNSLRKLFKRKKKSERWHTVPLNNIEDLNKIKEAIKILAEDSKNYTLEWL